MANTKVDYSNGCIMCGKKHPAKFIVSNHAGMSPALRTNMNKTCFTQWEGLTDSERLTLVTRAHQPPHTWTQPPEPLPEPGPQAAIPVAVIVEPKGATVEHVIPVFSG